MIQRYFLILTAGHSGSAWLAKLLNSHFEAMCFHELETITYALGWPPQVRAYFEFGEEERLRNLLYLFSPSHRYGDSYHVLGALPGQGVDLSVRRTMEAVATYFPDAVGRTRFFVLMRNPVSQVHSQTAACIRMGQWVAAHEQMRDHRDYSKQVLARMEPRLAQNILGEMERGDVDTEYFIHACLTNVQLIWAAQEAQATVPYPSVLQLEGLIQNETALPRG
jgi:hypothetical protein